MREQSADFHFTFACAVQIVISIILFLSPYKGSDQIMIHLKFSSTGMTVLIKLVAHKNGHSQDLSEHPYRNVLHVRNRLAEIPVLWPDFHFCNVLSVVPVH